MQCVKNYKGIDNNCISILHDDKIKSVMIKENQLAICERYLNTNKDDVEDMLQYFMKYRDYYFLTVHSNDVQCKLCYLVSKELPLCVKNMHFRCTRNVEWFLNKFQRFNSAEELVNALRKRAHELIWIYDLKIIVTKK